MSEEKAEYEVKPPLQIQVGMENGKVIVIFSQQLTTFTLPWDEAEKMADAIYHHAANARGEKQEPET